MFAFIFQASMLVIWSHVAIIASGLDILADAAGFNLNTSVVFGELFFNISKITLLVVTVGGGTGRRKRVVWIHGRLV